MNIIIKTVIGILILSRISFSDNINPARFIDTTKDRNWHVNLSFNFLNPTMSAGFSKTFYKNLAYGGRALATFESSFWDEVEPLEKYVEISGLIGGYGRNSKAATAAAVGLSLLYFSRRDKFLYPEIISFRKTRLYSERSGFTIGLPFEIRMYFNPFELVYGGLALTGNLSPEAFLIGLLFSVDI